MSSSSRSSYEIKYDIDPYDGTPGDDYDKFEERLLVFATRKTDERGYSLADHLLGIDEGSPGGPPLPVGAGAAKAAIALRQRQKNSFGLLTVHVTDAAHVTHMKNAHFQLGRDAFAYLRASCQMPVDALKLRQMNKEWDDISIMHDIGINPNSIKLLCKHIRYLDGKRPAGQRKSEDAKVERMLECIFETSKHFSEGATIEYNAAAGVRQFEFAAGPLAGQRDFASAEAHYHALWSQAVKNKLPGFHERAPQVRPSAPTRNTLEQGSMGHDAPGQVGRESPHSPHEFARLGDGNDTFVPRSGSPSRSLALLADAGDELADRRGTVTTTDFTLLSAEEIALAAQCEGCDNSFEVAYLFDGDDTASVEIICDCCKGLGHVKRVCPSNRSKFRSFEYAIAALRQRQLRAEQRGPMRRPPGRGQRPPFRSMPRRFAPRSTNFQPGRQRPRPALSARSADEGGSLSAPDDLYHDADDANLSSDSATRSKASASSCGSGGSSTAERESATSARESATKATEPKMPMSFSLSDDNLFSQEGGMIKEETGHMVEEVGQTIEERETPARAVALTRRSAFRLLAILIVGVAAQILTAFEYITRAVGVTLFVVVTTLIVAPLTRADTVDYSLMGGEVARLSTTGGAAISCIDSGATSTSLPESHEWMLTEVTDNNPSPDHKLWIANDKGLRIKRIGKAAIPVMGHELLPDNTLGPLKEVSIPCSRALVVQDFGKTILISTRGLLRDGVNTYLNDDNSLNRSDCLYIIRDNVVVPFIPSNHAYHVATRIRSHAANTASTAIPTSAPVEPATTTSTSDGDPMPNAVSRPRCQRPLHLIHRAVGHVGYSRLRASNLTIDGVMLNTLKHDESTCKGCRLGNTGKQHVPHNRSRHTTHVWRDPADRKPVASTGFAHFGQQVDTDICTGFAPSFPHGFTCMMNFCDRYTTEKEVYFMVSPSSQEVASSLTTHESRIKHRLRDGKIGRWTTDNGKSFLSEETNEVAQHICRDRGYQVQNDSDTLPVPERNWGVLQRMMRSDLAQADAPECVWSWGAHQAMKLLYYLPTAALTPVQSPYQFATGDTSPVDISWARTMYCDVSITIPERDRNSKLGSRGADACHLGYDSKRDAHYCYCPALQRLSSFIVTEWREDSFTIVKTVSADTPVEYVESPDLPIAPATLSMLPRRYTAREANDTFVYTLLFPGKPREGDIVSQLREAGHTVHAFDLAISDQHDLSKRSVQQLVLSKVNESHSVFMSPPCKTCSIAFVPPLRTIHEPTGRRDLSTAHRTLVDRANTLYDFCAEVIDLCKRTNKMYVLESAASRRTGPPKCRWSKFSDNGFIWDYPGIVDPNDATYICFAQCAFSNPWQKYTGLLVRNNALFAWQPIFGSADCVCASHDKQLKGYDVTGVANTSLAEAYNRPLCTAFTQALTDSCTTGTGWYAQLIRLSPQQLCDSCAAAFVSDVSADEEGAVQPVPNSPFKPPQTRTDIELWMEDAEGAYRVSEVGSVPVPKSLEEAKAHSLWPVIKTAMEDEIKGKMANKAWKVVKRPEGKHVLKSKWVFTIKYNDDGSIKLVKARFVACGYSQIEGSDFDKVFAATLPGVSFRCICTVIADEDLETDHIDAIKAFTQSDIDHEIYVEMPAGFESEGCVLLLYKALEGIRQGAYLWFQHNKSAWTSLDFVSWINEPNILLHKTLRIIVGIFADDILVGFAKEHEEQYIAIKQQYAKLIKIDNHGISPVLKFTGVQISRDRNERTLTINQHRYIEQLCTDYKGKFTEQETPYGVTREARKEFDNLTAADDKDLIDRGQYLQIMGKLVWPSTMTRVDISFAVNTLCSFVQSPGQIHYQKALNIVGYLSATRELGITYGGRLRTPLGLSEPPIHFARSHGLYCAHDSSFGTRPRPMGGYVVMYLNGAVDWSATNAKIVPDSAQEAESAAGSRAAKATLFIRELLKSMRRPIFGATAMLGDNRGLYLSIQQEGATARTRYYERAILLLKRAVLLLILSPFLVKTDDMMADMFTKALEKSTFYTFRNQAMNTQSSLRRKLEHGLSCTGGATHRLMHRLLQRL